MTEDQFQAWLTRLDKEKSRALRSYEYGNPGDFIRFDRERGGNMLHLKQAEESIAKREPVDRVLDIWASYISLADSCSPGGYANDQDVKDFMRTGEAVETMVNNLKRHQWWAIRKSKGICTQWIFKDAIYEDALTQAKEILVAKMRINVATARYFN